MTAAVSRVAGSVAIAVITLLGAVARPDPFLTNLATSFGIFFVVGFLWLGASGFFGYGSASRGDWIGLVPFLVALVLRESFTLHSVEGIEIQFATTIQIPSGPVGKHSVAYPLLQMFFVPIVRDAQWFTMHMNGVFGALAGLCLYLFVRQRTGSRSAGFFCALFFATHPLVARFAPTDGPYSLLLVGWFSGLALLSAPVLGARSIVGGAGLLGIAASLRLEGSLLLLASLLMLDVRALIDALRRHMSAAALSVLLVGTLIAVQMYFFLPMNLGGTIMYLPEQATFAQVGSLFFWPVERYGALYGTLFVAGILSGIVTRCRLGLLAFIAMLFVVAPVVNSVHATGLHRLVPACALQALVAGMGAFGIAAWASRYRGWQWFAFIPALTALYIPIAHRDDLTKPYVFTEEYALVRRHLAAGSDGGDNCTLMVFKAAGDEDVHNFDAVVPKTPVLDCRSLDCPAALPRGGCFYYLRSAACYFHDAGIPAACRDAGERGRVCLNALSASFEASVELQPVELRTINIGDTFPEWSRNYPQQAEIGLFRAYPKGFAE